MHNVNFDDLSMSPTSPLAETPLVDRIPRGDAGGATSEATSGLWIGEGAECADILELGGEETAEDVDGNGPWEKDELDGVFKKVESAGIRGGAEGSQIVIKRVKSDSKGSVVAATGSSPFPNPSPSSPCPQTWACIRFEATFSGARHPTHSSARHKANLKLCDSCPALSSALQAK